MVTPVPKPVPATQGKTAVRVVGTIHDDVIPIFILEDVLEDILDFSERDLQKEIGGFLVGGIFEDRSRTYIELQHFLPATDARSKSASLTFTHDTWARMTREVDQRFPEAHVLGWHHTHPGFGVFLSGYDLFIHRNFFREAWQIAMVVDPVQQEFRFFQWRQDEIVPCGFVVVTNEEAS